MKSQDTKVYAQNLKIYEAYKEVTTLPPKPANPTTHSVSSAARMKLQCTKVYAQKSETYEAHNNITTQTSQPHHPLRKLN